MLMTQELPSRTATLTIIRLATWEELSMLSIHHLFLMRTAHLVAILKPHLEMPDQVLSSPIQRRSRFLMKKNIKHSEMLKLEKL